MEFITEHGYEALRRAVQEIPPADSASRRSVRWLEPRVGLGVARDVQGRVEIFIAGPALECTSPIVAANLSHNEWERTDDQRFIANRLVLQAQPHFDAVAAFLCTHLLDSGLADDKVGAFRSSEPVIEMVFERSRMLGDTLVGLLGELLVLRAMIAAEPTHASEIVDGWFGHVRSSRDIQLSGVGVEVKTTQGLASTHPVSGIHQVEAGHGVDRAQESHLFLASIGIEPVPAGEEGDTTWTLPSLLESLTDLIRNHAGPAADSIADRLIVHVRDYGAGTGQPYDHREMKDRIAFGTAWRTTFARFYDMNDDKIELPRSGDLQKFSMLDSDSVHFTIRLPQKVDGDLNPVGGLAAGAAHVVSTVWPRGA